MDEVLSQAPRRAVARGRPGARPDGAQPVPGAVRARSRRRRSRPTPAAAAAAPRRASARTGAERGTAECGARARRRRPPCPRAVVPPAPVSVAPAPVAARQRARRGPAAGCASGSPGRGGAGRTGSGCRAGDSRRRCSVRRPRPPASPVVATPAPTRAPVPVAQPAAAAAAPPPAPAAPIAPPPSAPAKAAPAPMPARASARRQRPRRPRRAARRGERGAGAGAGPVPLAARRARLADAAGRAAARSCRSSPRRWRARPIDALAVGAAILAEPARPLAGRSDDDPDVARGLRAHAARRARMAGRRGARRRTGRAGRAAVGAGPERDGEYRWRGPDRRGRRRAVGVHDVGHPAGERQRQRGRGDARAHGLRPDRRVHRGGRGGRRRASTRSPPTRIARWWAWPASFTPRWSSATTTTRWDGLESVALRRGRERAIVRPLRGMGGPAVLAAAGQVALPGRAHRAAVEGRRAAGGEVTCRSSTTRRASSTSRSCTTARAWPARRRTSRTSTSCLPDGNKGKMISLATGDDRTLFFDFLPVSALGVRGFTTRFQLYTVPGPDALQHDPQARAARGGRSGLRGRLAVGPAARQRRELSQPRREPQGVRPQPGHDSPRDAVQQARPGPDRAASTTWSFSSTAASGAFPRSRPSPSTGPACSTP